MNKLVAKEDLAGWLGRETGVSEWIEIDQERINQFADVTLDHQFIHVDAEAAQKTPFGGTIAHGFLTLSMLSHLSEGNALEVKGTAMGVNYGTDKLRFVAPVRSGKRIRARLKLLSADEKPGSRMLMKYEATIEIEGEDKPALIAEWLFMIFLQ